MRNVITIARTLGAEGEEVGRLVAEGLGFRYADDEIISAAADRAGVSREAVERAEHPPGLIARIIENMGAIPMEPQVYYSSALAAQFPVRGGGYDDLIQRVIIETGDAGNVVIVAHGAGICLAGRPAVLRVLATAPEPVRIERLRASAGIDAKDAEKAISRSDNERREFLRRFYRVDHESSTHYDLTVNTETLGARGAADTIIAAARA